MSATLTKAVLTISIDLEPEGARLAMTNSHPLEAITDRLLEILARHEMAATWALAEPSASPIVERIVSRRSGHEIALLGDPSWAGAGAGRNRFGQELARRTAASQAQGHAITTLVVDAVGIVEQCDLAFKHGITAARHASADDSSPRRRMHPRTLRYGLWSFPVAQVLPGTSRLLLGGGGGRAVRSLIDRAIEHRGLAQLVVDVARLASRGYTAERVVDVALGHAEWRRRQGVLEVATIGAVATRLGSQHQGMPSRSILRPAA